MFDRSMFDQSVMKTVQAIIEKHRVEAVLIGVAILTILLSVVLFVQTVQANGTTVEENWTFEQAEDGLSINTNDLSEPTNTTEKLPTGEIYVDVSGAVKKPDVYSFSPGARLKNAIEKAGGMSEDAAKEFISRNYNMAKTLTDQEKIYIPSEEEIRSGIFAEKNRSLQYLGPNKNSSNPTSQSNFAPTTSTDQTMDAAKININIATSSELDTLPGVGKVTAQKIIDNRPYETVDDLLNKKVVGKSTFEGFKDMIGI